MKTQPKSRGAQFNRAMWLLTAALWALVLMPQIVSDGMFMDGLIYADLARNMAEGIGSVWEPKFSDTLFPVFSEHPPLMFWLQSLPFRIFGDSILVEKLFSAATGVATLMLVGAIWRRLASDEEVAAMTWFPALMALSMPTLSWGFANNVLENLVGVFALVAVTMLIPRNGTIGLCAVILAALATFAAVLTKGPIGLFPLATIGVAWLALGSPRFADTFLKSVLMTLLLVALFGALSLHPDARDNLQRYVEAQVMATLSGARGAAGGGLPAVGDLIGSVVIPFIICGLILLIDRRIEKAWNIPSRQAIFIGLLALSASVPILVSPRSNTFYFNASLPLYALAFALAAGPALLRLIRRLPERSLAAAYATGSACLAAAAGLAVAYHGTSWRDARIITDVKAIGTELCGGTKSCRQTVAICREVYRHWPLHAYFMRYHSITLDPGPERTEYAITHPACATQVPDGYTPVDIGTTYRLLRRTNPA